MENSQNNRKPIYDGILEQGEYPATVCKATPLPANGQLPPSIRVMFILEFPTCVSFVSGFINQQFQAGDKTSVWLKNLGVVPTSNITPVDQLVGKKCRIYIEPGKRVFSNNLQKEIQYYKIKALTSANKTVPVPTMATQAPVPTVQQPVQVQQAYQQPVVNAQAPNPFRQAQAVQPQPVQAPVPQIQPIYAVPQNGTVVNPNPYANTYQAPNVATAPVQAVPQQVAQPVVQPVVQQAVAQPLPTVKVNESELDF